MNIKALSITKLYPPSTKAISNISIDINPKDFICFVGETGSGKTTLLSLLSGIISPTSGEIYYDKYKLSTITEKQMAYFRSEILGIIFQEPYLLPELNIFENIIAPSIFSKKEKDYNKIKDYCLFLMKELNLESIQKRYPQSLSGGEIQKVTIARALINKPEVLIADEPTGEIDYESSLKISELFKKLNKMGLTIVMATHNFKIAKQSKTVYLLKKGEIVKILK